MSAFTDDDVKLARQLFPSLSELHFALYLSDCERLGIHPLDKKLHPQTRKDRNGNVSYAPVTSIDYMRMRAESTEQYSGSSDAVYVYVEGTDKLVSAKVTVLKLLNGVVGAFSATARWDEYYPGEIMGQMWRKMPHVMLAKCAEALALRKGFPGVLSGLYAREEMQQADAVVEDHKPSLRAPAAKRVVEPTETITSAQRGELIQAATSAGWALGDLKVFVEKRTGVSESAKILQQYFAPLLAEVAKGPEKALFTPGA